MDDAAGGKGPSPMSRRNMPGYLTAHSATAAFGGSRESSLSGNSLPIYARPRPAPLAGAGSAAVASGLSVADRVRRRLSPGGGQHSPAGMGGHFFERPASRTPPPASGFASSPKGRVDAGPLVRRRSLEDATPAGEVAPEAPTQLDILMSKTLALLAGNPYGGMHAGTVVKLSELFSDDALDTIPDTILDYRFRTTAEQLVLKNLQMPPLFMGAVTAFLLKLNGASTYVQEALVEELDFFLEALIDSNCTKIPTYLHGFLMALTVEPSHRYHRFNVYFKKWLYKLILLNFYFAHAPEVDCEHLVKRVLHRNMQDAMTVTRCGLVRRFGRHYRLDLGVGLPLTLAALGVFFYFNLRYGDTDTPEAKAAQENNWVPVLAFVMLAFWLVTWSVRIYQRCTRNKRVRQLFDDAIASAAPEAEGAVDEGAGSDHDSIVVEMVAGGGGMESSSPGTGDAPSHMDLGFGSPPASASAVVGLHAGAGVGDASSARATAAVSAGAGDASPAGPRAGLMLDVPLDTSGESGSPTDPRRRGSTSLREMVEADPDSPFAGLTLDTVGTAPVVDRGFRTPEDARRHRVQTDKAKSHSAGGRLNQQSGVVSRSASLSPPAQARHLAPAGLTVRSAGSGGTPIRGLGLIEVSLDERSGLEAASERLLSPRAQDVDALVKHFAFFVERIRHEGANRYAQRPQDVVRFCQFTCC